MSKNAEWVNSENLFFHLFRMQSQCKPNAERRELALKSYAEVQPDFTEGKVSANRMQSDESLLSRAMLRCSLTSQCNVSANRMQNLKTRFRKLCWGAAWLRDAKIQSEGPEIQLFSASNIAPRKFSIPPNGHSALYLRAFSCIFHTRKKMKSGYNILSHADYQNIRSSNVWPHPNAAAPTPFCYWS